MPNSVHIFDKKDLEPCDNRDFRICFHPENERHPDLSICSDSKPPVWCPKGDK